MGSDHPGYPCYMHEYTNDFIVAYRDYLKSIRSQLPADLAALFGFGDAIQLHDGRIRDFAFDFLQRAVRFCVYRIGPRTQYAAVYGGVSEFSCRVINEPRLAYPVSGQFDIWRYEDVAVLANGGYEHRILFVSGIEIVIRFTSFTLTSEVLAEQDAPADQPRD